MNAPTPRPRTYRRQERVELRIPPCYRCGHRGTPERPLMLERETQLWRCAWACMVVDGGTE